MSNSAYSYLVCPTCLRSAFQSEGRELVCTCCGLRAHNLNGVPLMVPRDKLVDKAESLRSELQIERADKSEMSDVFAASLMFGYRHPSLSAEFANLEGRFESLRFAMRPGADNDAGYGGFQEQDPAPLVALTEIHAPAFVPGQLTWRSLRIENRTADITYETVGATPHHLSYHLYKADGSIVTFEGERSRIPVPLKPGAQLTVPLRIRAPEAPGQYRLDVHHVQELVAWGTAPIYSTTIRVAGDVRDPACDTGHAGDFDYGQDWLSSMEMLKSTLKGGERILEVACGMHPLALTATDMAQEIVAIDLCYPELQLAKLHYRERLAHPERVKWICADIDELPVQKGGFDVLVICAALHHFPDPIAALSRLRDYLAPGGRFVIVREPCGTNPADVNYLEQLSLGFNEQQFELAEYAWIFERAGLKIERMQRDFGGSLKAILSNPG